jgi:putative transposase
LEWTKYLLLTYRFRIYPSAQQEALLIETLETCRRLYNDLLDERIRSRKGVFEQNRELTQKRKQSKYLMRVYCQVLQDVAFRLDKAFNSFQAGLSKFPRFKRIGKYNSITYPQPCPKKGFILANGRLVLPFIGKVRIKVHRIIHGHTKLCTVIKDIDRWFACLVTEFDEGVVPPSSDPPVGVDLGIAPIVTLSNGQTIPSLKFLKESEVEIRSHQRSLSRKRKGSKNREKAKILLAKYWRKVRNRRKDFTHKTSRYLADNYGLVVFEDLAIKNMVKNHKLASAILDACWGELRRLTAYKAERRGGREILVEPSGSSQECCVCGTRRNMPLSERRYTCQECGLVLDRDVNAARNVLSRGLEEAHAEAEPLSITRIGKFSRGSKKSASEGRGQFTAGDAQGPGGRGRLP